MRMRQKRRMAGTGNDPRLSRAVFVSHAGRDQHIPPAQLPEQRQLGCRKLVAQIGPLQQPETAAERNTIGRWFFSQPGTQLAQGFTTVVSPFYLQRQKTQQRPPDIRLQPVSYTHLRAHETF